jgi:hypothetical protein
MPGTKAAPLQGCGFVPRAGTRNAFENDDENENGRSPETSWLIDSPDNQLNFFN